jgi:hypothetical protein
MLCEIARGLNDEQLEQVQALERELGLTVVAFACRSLEPEKEERLQKAMEGLGPVLQAELAKPDDAQLDALRATEEALGLPLVAVRPS